MLKKQTLKVMDTPVNYMDLKVGRSYVIFHNVETPNTVVHLKLAKLVGKPELFVTANSPRPIKGPWWVFETNTFPTKTFGLSSLNLFMGKFEFYPEGYAGFKRGPPPGDLPKSYDEEDVRMVEQGDSWVEGDPEGGPGTKRRKTGTSRRRKYRKVTRRRRLQRR